MSTVEQGSAAPEAVPEFSIIVTCYNEQDSLDEFHQRLTKTMQGLGRTYEIVFVNDGSQDQTLKKLEALYACDPRVNVVMDLYSNAGQAAAITAGFGRARGEKFVLIDCDLQLDPEDLPLLVAEYDKGRDLVNGYRVNRDDPLRRRLASRVLNLLMNRVVGGRVRDFGCTFRIIDGKLIRAFNYGPFKVFQPSYLFSRIRNVSETPVTHHARKHGASGYTAWKMLMLLWDNLVGLMDRTFLLVGLTCAVISLLSFLGILLGWANGWRGMAETGVGLILGSIMVNLLVTVSVACLLGEFAIRSYRVLNQHPAYVIRTLLIRDAGGKELP